MAYPHFQTTVQLLATTGDPSLSAISTGDKGSWRAGCASYFVRRVAVQKTATDAWAAAAKFSFRKACGAAGSATGGQFASITFATTALREDGMRFNDSFTPTKIPAGYGIIVNVVTAATGERFYAWAMIEPSVDRLQNLGTGAFISVTA